MLQSHFTISHCHQWVILKQYTAIAYCLCGGRCVQTFFEKVQCFSPMASKTIKNIYQIWNQKCFVIFQRHDPGPKKIFEVRDRSWFGFKFLHFHFRYNNNNLNKEIPFLSISLIPWHSAGWHGMAGLTYRDNQPFTHINVIFMPYSCLQAI